jgi:hypothetical protein
VTLRPRFNQHSGEDPPVPPGELPFSVDPRQLTLFGAAWTVGSIKYLAESGTRFVTYYETTGWRGVMEREAGSPLPARFASLPGSVFPLYHILNAAGEFAGGEVIRSRSGDPLRLESLALAHGSRRRILVANMTRETVEAEIAIECPIARVRTLDETNIGEAMESPHTFIWSGGERSEAPEGRLRITLRPHAVASIEPVVGVPAASPKHG